MHKLSGVILAAGLSSRMGAFKPLMNIGGQPMITHVIGTMRRAGASPIVVVTGHRHDELEAALAGDPDVVCVYNPDYATTQQLESLRLALNTLKGQADRVMISPADVPLVSDTTAQTIRDTDGDFVRPVWHGEYGHPVFLKAEWFDYLMTYDGPGGLRGAMERSGCRLIDQPVEDRGTVLDNDTPADVSTLMAWSKDRTNLDSAADNESNENEAI